MSTSAKKLVLVVLGKLVTLCLIRLPWHLQYQGNNLLFLKKNSGSWNHYYFVKTNYLLTFLLPIWILKFPQKLSKTSANYFVFISVIPHLKSVWLKLPCCTDWNFCINIIVFAHCFCKCIMSPFQKILWCQKNVISASYILLFDIGE